jgi:ornithine cyclodeaminase/alanine dehydrogenase-like protein (mu-crystallin family)
MDLEILLKQPANSAGRKAFFFKGIASADLAVAAHVYQQAVELNKGVLLGR